MNGEIRFQGIAFEIPSWQQRLFRLALLASFGAHAVGFLTSPAWQSPPAPAETVVSVDLADLPASQMPSIPAPPRAPAAAAPRAKEAPVREPPPPSREEIREKVASRGIARMLAGDGGKGAPLSGLRIPADAATTASSPPREGDYRPTGKPGESRSPWRPEDPGISRQVATASRSSTALSSRVFTTDSGLKGEISGAIEDASRTEEAITKVIRQYRSGIRYVYNKELAANPDLNGEIVVAFVIRPDGMVESAQIRSSTVGWAPLEEAVLRKVAYWKFPRATGGTVQVVFPFRFLPEM